MSDVGTDSLTIEMTPMPIGNGQDEYGRYYEIQGYWRSSISVKNMFYTSTAQTDIEQRCKETLGVTHDAADLMYYASDSQVSYNHSIWTNDPVNNDKINRIITFGDSLSNWQLV